MIKIAILTLVTSVAIACINVGAGDLVLGAPTVDAGEHQESGREGTYVITAEPTTFNVDMSDDLREHIRQQLEAGSLEVVRLVIRRLEAQSASELKGVRIFIDKPDADATTSLDDPHYGGNFVLGLEDGQSMLFNVAPTLSRIWSAKDLDQRNALTVTFVAEGWDWAEGLADGFALAVDEIAFEAQVRD